MRKRAGGRGCYWCRCWLLVQGVDIAKISLHLSRPTGGIPVATTLQVLQVPVAEHGCTR